MGLPAAGVAVPPGGLRRGRGFLLQNPGVSPGAGSGADRRLLGWRLRADGLVGTHELERLLTAAAALPVWQGAAMLRARVPHPTEHGAPRLGLGTPSAGTVCPTAAGAPGTPSSRRPPRTPEVDGTFIARWSGSTCNRVGSTSNCLFRRAVRSPGRRPLGRRNPPPGPGLAPEGSWADGPVVYQSAGR